MPERISGRAKSRKKSEQISVYVDGLTGTKYSIRVRGKKAKVVITEDGKSASFTIPVFGRSFTMDDLGWAIYLGMAYRYGSGYPHERGNFEDFCIRLNEDGHLVDKKTAKLYYEVGKRIDRAFRKLGIDPELAYRHYRNDHLELEREVYV